MRGFGGGGRYVSTGERDVSGDGAGVRRNDMSEGERDGIAVERRVMRLTDLVLVFIGPWWGEVRREEFGDRSASPTKNITSDSQKWMKRNYVLSPQLLLKVIGIKDTSGGGNTREIRKGEERKKHKDGA